MQPESPLNHHPPPPELPVERLIARSGIIGRQILKLYRFMREGENSYEGSGVGAVWLRQQRLRQSLKTAGISKLADLLYTYYLGGSLTRQDQITFAKIQGMDERAYFLTGVNALACGIPTALSYFLAGEGFTLLSKVNSYAELPALLAGHTSLGIGVASLVVDLFRAVDSFLNKRCWAPLGIFPLLINMPTYFNRTLEKMRGRRQLVGKVCPKG